MNEETQRTEPQSAPVASAPRPKRMSRQGDNPVPYVQRWPDIRGGVCEYCGILDSNIPSQYQYKLCQHYRDVGTVRCNYCDATKDPDDVAYHSNMTMYENPLDSSELIALCNSYSCTEKHEKRFGAK